MRGSYGIDEHGQLRDEREMRFRLDEDSPLHAVIHSRQSAYVRQNHPLYNDQSQVVGHGWSAIGVLRDGDESIGWLAADNLLSQKSLHSYEPELLALYGATVGHLVNQKRAEAALRRREEADRRFQEQLRSLHEVTVELSHVTSFHELCYRAIELGRSRLGFDRLGLWFLDEDPDYMVGTFGTDEQGNIRDERQQRVSTTFTPRQEVMAGRVLMSAEAEVPLYNDRHEIVGYGWNAAAQVRDGDKLTGWLSTDNFFNRQPVNDYILELLALYATTIGHFTRTLRAREELAAERNLLRTIMDAVPDYIYVKDREARFTLANRAAWSALPGAKDISSIIGKSDFEFFPPEIARAFYAVDRQVLDSGVAAINVEERGDYFDNVTRWLLTTKVPLYDTSGAIIGLAGVTRNITEYKMMEQQARQLEMERVRLALLQEFITSISHDLRTPLASINTSLYLLERVHDPVKQQKHFDLIKKQVAHLDHVIEDILTIVRLDNMPELTLGPVNLNRLATDVHAGLETLIQQKGLIFQKHPADELPLIDADEPALFQAFTEITANAVNYTPSGGTVTIATYRRDNQVIFEVQDTGTGISAADIPHIFERFYRADKARSQSKGGSGLGLAIAQKIVEMHRGNIEVESTPGAGSIFRVVLPLKNPPENPT